MKQETAQKDYRSYEYKQVVVKEERTSFCIDCYENFGWMLDERQPIRMERGQSTISFRRDRNILNKAELTRLERNFSGCISELDELERSKTASPTMLSLSCALLGTGFMAGATFAATAEPPLYLFSALLAVPGFLGWLFPYFIYRKGVARRTEKVTPFLNAKYEEIDAICRKGRSLL